MAEDRGRSIVAGNIIVAVVATVAVGLRFLARRLQRISLGVDDYLILAALPLGWALCVSTVVAVHYGLSKHENALDSTSRVKEEKAYYASEILWALAIPFIKASILMLYCYIFWCLRYFRRVACAIGTFSICWSVAVVIALACKCRPIQAVWDKSIQGSCFSNSAFYIGSSVPNTITDIAILLLPMKAVAQLHTTRSQELLLVFIFSLGSLTCVISLLRLIAVIQLPRSDQTWTLSRIAIWTAAEPCLGIVSACLPTMRPLLRRIPGQQNGRRMSNEDVAAVTERISLKRRTDSLDQIHSGTTKPSIVQVSDKSVDSSETYPDNEISRGASTSTTNDVHPNWSDTELGLRLEDRRK